MQTWWGCVWQLCTLAHCSAHPPAKQSYSSSAPSFFLIFVFTLSLAIHTHTHNMFHSGKLFIQSSGYIFKRLFLAVYLLRSVCSEILLTVHLGSFFIVLFVYAQYNIVIKQKHFKAVLYNKLFLLICCLFFLTDGIVQRTVISNFCNINLTTVFLLVDNVIGIWSRQFTQPILQRSCMAFD